jgi:hypothetical protein
MLVVLEVARAHGFSEMLGRAVVAASSNSEAKVRRQVVALLVDWLPRQASLRPLLEKIAKSDPDPRIRTLAETAQ